MMAGDVVTRVVCDHSEASSDDGESADIRPMGRSGWLAAAWRTLGIVAQMQVIQAGKFHSHPASLDPM